MSRERIQGKKIRNQVFYNALFIMAAVIAISFLLASILPSAYILTVQLMASIVLLLLFVTLLSFRKVLCILSDDRLHYFSPKNYGIEFILISGNKRKVLSEAGSIIYADIQKCEYFPRPFSSFVYRSYTLSQHVVLYGPNFELKITGVGKRFIKQLERAQQSCIVNDNTENSATDTSDIQIIQHVRYGLWKEIWQSFENGALENVFGNYKIIRMEGNESLDTIDILVDNNGHEMDFNMDNCSIYMTVPDNDTDQTIYYEHLSDLEALVSVIREFAVSNS